MQASNTSLADFAVVIAENTSHVGLVVVDFSVRKSFSVSSDYSGRKRAFTKAGSVQTKET